MNVTLETVRSGSVAKRVIAFPMPDGSKRLLTYNAIAEWLGKGIDVVCKRAKTLDPSLILSTQNAGVGRKLIPNRDWQRDAETIPAWRPAGSRTVDGVPQWGGGTVDIGAYLATYRRASLESRRGAMG